MDFLVHVAGEAGLLRKGRTMPDPARIRYVLTGQIQGVGFRPFIYRLATQLALTGHIRNTPAGVTLELQGPASQLTQFDALFHTQLPPLARIDHLEKAAIPPIPNDPSFTIAPSDESAIGNTQSAIPSLSPQSSVLSTSSVTIDTAVCPDCLRELFDPQDRRHHYGLINCTNCGPRFSIIHKIPYDRPNTTMSAFPLCDPCRTEYLDPLNRRFHAQPTCCPTCGPTVELVPSSFAVRGSQFAVPSSQLPVTNHQLPSSPHSALRTSRFAFSSAASLLLSHHILAIKGLGGFHLACRADSDQAVQRLRKLKHRDAKPFALMVRDLATAQQLVDLSPVAIRELASPRTPIILAPKRGSEFTLQRVPQPHSDIADSSTDSSFVIRPSSLSPLIAPHNSRLGLMLPYTPIHHLLFAHLPPEVSVLIMTSGNLSDEPLAITNEDALTRLAPLCDAFLLHNRPIARPVDDSIYMDCPSAGGGPPPVLATGNWKLETPLLPIRRSRGYAPTPIPLSSFSVPRSAFRLPPGLCLGAELKSTVAVVRPSAGGAEALLSQHLGDLTNAAAYDNFKRIIDDLLHLFSITPQFIAHDLHPNYLSTVYARELAAKLNLPLIPVQHHHAHAAAVLAEHAIAEPALALILDGTGYGPDNSIWGGELLHVLPDGTFTRLGRLKPIRLPGGDAAARDTRRPALALLASVLGDSFDQHPLARQLFPDPHERAVLAAMIRKGFNAPWTSSTGRYFDAVSCLLGVAQSNRFEAEAAIALESVATQTATLDPAQLPAPRIHQVGDLLELDLSSFLEHLLAQSQQILAGVQQAPGRDEPAPAGDQACAAGALAYHAALARGYAQLAATAAARTGIKTIGLSGGVFANQLFTQFLLADLGKIGLRPLTHAVLPCNDGGIAFGQAAVALQRLSQR